MELPPTLAAWKLAPALATGNTCLLSSPSRPLTSLWLGKLLLEAGVSEGVVNVLTGFGETAGAAMTRHPCIAGVSFTGSTAVGREVVRASAGNLAKCTALELGGKSPNVVFADADFEAAVGGAANAIFYNMGQDCAAGSRLFVQRDVYDEFVAGMAAKANGLKLGFGLDDGVDQGPLVSRDQLERVMAYVRAGLNEGAERPAVVSERLEMELTGATTSARRCSAVM